LHRTAGGACLGAIHGARRFLLFAFSKLSFRNPSGAPLRVSLTKGFLVSKLIAFLKDEDGPTAVEYAVQLALVIVVCISTIQTLGSNSNNTFSYVGTKVSKTSGS
jgi:pilus assembly protein Flp/PilA